MASNDVFSNVYEFGPFTLNLGAQALYHNGTPVPLPPKCFEVLVVLVENSGRLLEKDEFLSRVWADCFVEESNLTQAVFTLRKALGESGTKQQYIETVPRRGYRFVADLRVVNGKEKPISVVPIAHPPTPGPCPESAGDDTVPAAHPSEIESIVAGKLVRTDFFRPRVDLGTLGKVVAWFVAGSLCAVAVGVGAARIAERFPRTGDGAFPFEKPSMRRLTALGNASHPALSPDGKYVAQVVHEGELQAIRVQAVASTSQVDVVPATRAVYLGLTFTPDGDFICFVRRDDFRKPGIMYRVPMLGGAPQAVLSDVDGAVTFSPSGTETAFVRQAPDQLESRIVIVESDGRERVAATRNLPEYFSPDSLAWSPDGRTLSCAVGKLPAGMPMRMMVVDVASGAVKPACVSHWDWIGQTAWLPDGDHIVFDAGTSDSSAVTDQLWAVSYPGGDARRVTNDMSSYAGITLAKKGFVAATSRSNRIARLWIEPLDPAESSQSNSIGFSDNRSERFGMTWTPRGRILYASQATGNLDLWEIDPDGKNPKQLTQSPQADSSPTVSADGSRIAFLSGRTGTPQVWTMDATGGNLKQVTNDEGIQSPVISPDGRWVLYTTWATDKRVLWKVSSDGGAPIRLTDRMSSFPSVSPDGKRVAFFLYDEKSKRRRIALMSLDQADATKPPELLIDSAKPVDWGTLKWSVDGRALTYGVTENGVSNIWSQPIDGGRAKQVTRFAEDRIYRFAWSPDGKHLACERGMTVKDLILIDGSK